MSSLLLVIDLQKSFINKHTEKLPGRIEQLINSNKYDNIVFTRFINFEDSIFVKKLNWKGCLQEEDRKIVIDTKTILYLINLFIHL